MSQPNPNPREQIRVEFVDGITIIHFLNRGLTAPHDIQDAQQLGQQLYSLVEVEAGGNIKLLVNFRDVEWVPTFILGRLIGLKRKVETVGGQLKLCGLNTPLVIDEFKISKLDQIFSIYPNESEAIAAFTNQSS